MTAVLPRRSIRLWGLRIAVLCAGCLCGGGLAFGQVFQLTGGTSSMVNAHGGALEMQTDNSIARLDLGIFNSPSVGFFYRRPFHDMLLGAGDQQIPFVLPTDLFDRSFYTIGRGASLTRKKKKSELFIFAGVTADGFVAPFLNVAHADTPAGMVFYDRQLSPTLKFVSRNVFSRSQTSIQSLEWAARKDIRMALSAGAGNNQGYWASSLTLDRHWVVVDASYADAGSAFRRVLVATPQLAENDRENVRVQFSLSPNWRVIASRNNYQAPPGSGIAGHAAVDGLGVWTRLATVQLYGSLFQSSVGPERSTAIAVGTRRQLTRRLDVGLDYLHSTNALGQSNGTVVGSVREVLSSRLTLNQVITSGNGRTNVSYGGSFLSNFVTISVDYQTVFLPFVQYGTNQFEQVLALGLHFQLPRGIQLNAETNVNPLGKVVYTAYASTYASRMMAQQSPGASISGGFFRNVVKGEVHDPQGEPVAGAALHIGNELAVTDSDGQFLVRVKKEGMLPLSVALDEFTAPGQYVVVSAPSSAMAKREEEAMDYEIVVKRVPTTASSSAEPATTEPVSDSPIPK